MEKEDILEISRREHQNRDLAELEASVQAGNLAGRVGALLVVGVTSLIAMQTFLNIGVVTGLLPATGISLPFFSYGGTALLIQLAEMGVVLSVSRALPDVRDGLKPVQRRVLFGMEGLGLSYSGQTKKSARIVGEVLGKYHPHGDSSVYDAMARLAQNWNQRYPLVWGQGNFGSMDGDPVAAMRYTEAKLAKMADDVLGDLDKDTVDFTNNFDDTLQEPTVLPTKAPLLLLNGASGIAVVMATNMAPHNLGEVSDAICAYIDNPEIDTDGLMKYIKGPDFPTGGIIMTTPHSHPLYE